MYGPKVAALGKRGKAHPHTAIAMSKDLICQNTLSKRQLPAGVTLTLPASDEIGLAVISFGASFSSYRAKEAAPDHMQRSGYRT